MNYGSKGRLTCTICYVGPQDVHVFGSPASNPNFSEIMAHLRSYAVGESAEISLKSALAEARDTLREVRKRREFSDSDIAVRTELSYARQGSMDGRENFNFSVAICIQPWL